MTRKKPTSIVLKPTKIRCSCTVLMVGGLDIKTKNIVNQEELQGAVEDASQEMPNCITN